MSHTCRAYHVEHNAQGTPPHHGFNILINIECACVEYYPWVYCAPQDIWMTLPSI